LPSREYMEDALRLWQAAGLPELRLREPWDGRPDGGWDGTDREQGQELPSNSHPTIAEPEAVCRPQWIVSTSRRQPRLVTVTPPSPDWNARVGQGAAPCLSLS